MQRFILIGQTAEARFPLKVALTRPFCHQFKDKKLQVLGCLISSHAPRFCPIDSKLAEVVEGEGAVGGECLV